MEQATYLQEQDFESAGHNTKNYVMVAASQEGIVSFDASTAGGIFVPKLADYCGPVIPFQALTENRPPIFASAMRHRFKQRTFPGKPLSDEEAVHANRIASEIEDDYIHAHLDE